MQESISSKVAKICPQREIYKIGGIIGAGTFGTVFKGYDKQNGRIVALKYILNNNSQTWRKQIKALQMFDHPNIVKYYCYIPDIDPTTQKLKGIYIVTEFVRGKTLEQYIASAEKVREKGLSQAMVFKIFLQLLEGFDHIHSKGFVHRDIKPQNILIDQNQNVKIIDLGQTKQRILLKTKGLGTPLYAAPQTFSGENPTDFRRDVWSLGLVLYEMITGKCYFEEWKECEGQQKFRRHLQTCKIKIKYPLNFDPFWKEITKKMLTKNYNLRINLHQIIFQLKSKYQYFEKKFNDPQKNLPILKNLTLTSISGNTNPLTQSQNEFEFSRTKKYLKYFKSKHRLLVLLVNMLSKYKYPFLSNAHKLILVFLSLNIYIASIDHLLKRLEKNKIIITQNQKYDLTEFEDPYKTAMVQFFSAYRQYYEKQSKFAKNAILQRIIPKFSQNHYKSQSSQADSLDSTSSNPISPRELLESYKNVKKLIQDFKQGINYTKFHYIQIFKQVIFSEGYYQPQQTIRNYFYQEDMSIYYLFMIIANLDEILSWGHDYLGNEIPKLEEELENLRKSEEEINELISKIAKYNNKI